MTATEDILLELNALRSRCAELEAELALCDCEEDRSTLHDAQAVCKFAIEGSGDGVWDCHFITGKATYSSRWKEMLGYSDDDILPAHDEWVTRIHPDDAEYVAHTMLEYIEGRSDIYRVEYRLKCKDGTYKWILGRGLAVDRTECGTPIRMVGTHVDITTRKELEAELRIAAVAFESQEGVLVSDSNNVVLRVNKSFTRITGYTNEEVVGKTPQVLASGVHPPEFYADMWQHINDEGCWSGEIYNKRKNGEIYPEQLTITAVKDEHGIVTNYVASLQDISDTKAQLEEIKRLAFYDPLTGLSNRRLLQDRCDQAIKQAVRSNTLIAVLMLDLDHFKEVNDTHGHLAGDEVLTQVASRLTSVTRNFDTVSRLGGDEFTILLCDLTTSSAVDRVASDILQTLSMPFILSHGITVTIGVSIGVSYYNINGSNLEELLHAADNALYKSKHDGRNRYTIHSGTDT